MRAASIGLFAASMKGGDSPDQNDSSDSEPSLDPETEIVRGGDGSSPFSEGTGVTVNPDGTLDGVSVNGENGVSGGESSKKGKIKNKNIRIATEGEVEAAGGVVVPDGLKNGDNHCAINGCTEEQLEDIFNDVTPNPSSR